MQLIFLSPLKLQVPRKFNAGGGGGGWQQHGMWCRAAQRKANNRKWEEGPQWIMSKHEQNSTCDQLATTSHGFRPQSWQSYLEMPGDETGTFCIKIMCSPFPKSADFLDHGQHKAWELFQKDNMEQKGKHSLASESHVKYYQVPRYEWKLSETVKAAFHLNK